MGEREKLIAEIGYKYVREENDIKEKFTILFPNKHIAMISFIKDGMSDCDEDSVITIFDDTKELIVATPTMFTNACAVLKSYYTS